MLGYYKLDESTKKQLGNAINVEEHLYQLVYPLIIGESLPQELACLYEMLEIPILSYDEYQQNKRSLSQKQTDYFAKFSEYLSQNTEVELLEEGSLGHLLRVGYYAQELCRYLNLSKEETKEIYFASLFHDLGKTKLPRELLRKPAKLTEEEFELMKLHSVYSYDVLKDFFNDHILEIIRCHHERCDRSGYPDGILPNLGARILGIADSYDTMLSQRVYQTGCSIVEALEELKRCTIQERDGGKGVLYDKVLVELFIHHKLKEHLISIL